MDLSSFTRYQLSPGQAIGDSLRLLMTHTLNEEAILETHRFLKKREANDPLKRALRACVDDPSCTSLEVLLKEFTGFEKSLTHHHKYAQASLGLASMSKKGKRTNAADKRIAGRETTSVMRNRLLPRILLELTFAPFFDGAFTMTKLQGILMGQLDEFFNVVRALKLQEQYINASKRLAPLLEPLPVDVVLNTLLELDHPELYGKLYLPSKVHSLRAASENLISQPIPEDIAPLEAESRSEGEESEESEESEVQETGMRNTVIAASRVCYEPQES